MKHPLPPALTLDVLRAGAGLVTVNQSLTLLIHVTHRGYTLTREEPHFQRSSPQSQASLL